MSIESFDYSERAFTEALGTDVMEQIRQSVTAAPPPGPLLVERIRTIFAPTVERLSHADTVGVEAA